MDPLFEIGIELAAKGSRGTARSLYRQLRAAILDGRLRPGARMPATRKAEQFFGVSRNTAAEVYDRLAAEGYLATRRGSGAYVSDRSPQATSEAPANDAAAPDHRLNPFWLQPQVSEAMGFWRDRTEAPSPDLRDLEVDFRPALIDSRLFPFDVFRTAMAKALRALETRPARFKSPQGNQGNFRLRVAVSEHIAVTRAVVCRPDDVLVSSGAQQAFDLIARVMVTPGETVVAVEDPGYPPMRVAFAAAGARLVPVPVDDEGLVVDALPTAVGVICVCPSHQFPLGVAMSTRRRRALVDFARARGAVIVEDDYDGEFRYEGAALEALRAGDAADVVFYVGTFSKCMLPALRLGFIVAPPWAMRTLTAAKNALDWHSSTPVQMGVAGFIADGHLTRHVRRMRTIYAERRQRLLDLLESDLANWLTPIPSAYGMHVAAEARTSADLDWAAEGLLAQGVKLHTFERYFLGERTRSGLVFGYGAAGPPEIDRGLGLLCETLAKG